MKNTYNIDKFLEEEAEKEAAAKYHSDQMHAQTYGRKEDGSLAEAGTELSGLDRLEEEGFSQRLNQKLNEQKDAEKAEKNMLFALEKLLEASKLKGFRCEKINEKLI